MKNEIQTGVSSALLWGDPSAAGSPVVEDEETGRKMSVKEVLKLSADISPAALQSLFECKSKLLSLIKLLTDPELTWKLCYCVDPTLQDDGVLKTLNPVAYRFLWREIFCATAMQELITLVHPWHQALQMYRCANVSRIKPEDDVGSTLAQRLSELDLRNHFVAKSYPDEILCIGQLELRNEIIDTYESLAGLTLSEYQKFRIQQLSDLGPSKSLMTISSAANIISSAHEEMTVSNRNYRLNQMLLDDFDSQVRNQQWLKDLASRCATIDNQTWIASPADDSDEMKSLIKDIDFSGKGTSIKVEETDDKSPQRESIKTEGEVKKEARAANGRAARLANRNMKSALTNDDEMMIGLVGKGKSIPFKRNAKPSELTGKRSVKSDDDSASKMSKARKGSISEESKRQSSGLGRRAEASRFSGRRSTKKNSAERSRSSSLDRGASPESSVRGKKVSRRMTRAASKKLSETSTVVAEEVVSSADDDISRKRPLNNDSEEVDEGKRRRLIIQQPVTRLRYVTRSSSSRGRRDSPESKDESADPADIAYDLSAIPPVLEIIEPTLMPLESTDVDAEYNMSSVEENLRSPSKSIVSEL
eukprot:GHVH01011025.1.p2 GENE.GHVH01011025.1~~GHVH01011025.1.p2  ORF type:complete len:590 (+),score=91.58 GHVH01011025.1:2087-3856(+)